MLRQFDVIVVSKDFNSEKKVEPPFTDPSLAWFFVSDINEGLAQSEAEWIVVTWDGLNVNREFLNNLAECNGSFPMVDALAPRVKKLSGKFEGGSILSKKGGFSRIPENEKLRYVAIPHPAIAAFSRRIAQRTGKIDTSLPTEFQLADYTLRMLHAGGRLFSIPYLVIDEAKPAEFSTSIKDYNEGCIKALYKGLGFGEAMKFAIHHPASFGTLFKNRKKLNAQRESSITLSKMKPGMLRDIRE